MIKKKNPNVPKQLYEKFLTQAQKTLLEFLKNILIFFEIERNHNVQYEYDNNFFYQNSYRL